MRPIGCSDKVILNIIKVVQSTSCDGPTRNDPNERRLMTITDVDRNRKNSVVLEKPDEYRFG